VLESYDQGAGVEEGSTGVPIPGSPGLRMRRSGGATTVKAAVEERSARAHSRHGGRDKGGADVMVPFYRVRGGEGRPGVGDERGAAVVHHNGDEGGRFGRGSSGE
jgi:hypothetical protein